MAVAPSVQTSVSRRKDSDQCDEASHGYVGLHLATYTKVPAGLTATP
jgi:hypothetical protein